MPVKNLSELDGVKNGNGIIEPDAPLRLSDLNPDDPTVKTNRIAPQTILRTNSTLHTLNLALKKEQDVHEKINLYANQMESNAQNMRRLSELKKMISSMQGDTVPAEVKNKIEELKTHGIHIYPKLGTKMTKVERDDLKADISSKTDELKTDSYNIFNLKINSANSCLQVFLNAMKGMVERSAKETEVYMRNQRGR